MSRKCTIVFLNEVRAKVVGLDPKTTNKCIDKLKYLVPYRFHVASYRLGRWDGSVRFFDKSGKTYINLLEEVIPIIASAGYDFEFDDKRENQDITVPKISNDIFAEHVWPTGHFKEGEPIMLRDDQTEAANIFADNRYALQVLATGFGKCVSGNTVLDIKPFGKTTIKDFYEHVVMTGKQVSNINEYSISADEHYKIQSSNGDVQIHGVTKKESTILKFTFSNGHVVQVSPDHKFFVKGLPVEARQVKKYGFIDTFNGELDIEDVIMIEGIHDVYDISVDYPNSYYDADGILHHNTLLTAAICKVVEGMGRTLTIVPSQSLVEQTADDFKLVEMDVGRYYSDHKEPSHKHTITTWQSLNEIIESNDAETFHAMTDGVVQVLVDECHQAKAKSLENILGKFLHNVPLRRGFTGTIPKEIFDAKTIISHLGNVVNRVTAKELQDRGILSRCHVNCIVTKDKHTFTTYDQEAKWLNTNGDRLQFMSEFVGEVTKSGNTLVLVNSVAAGEELNDMIPNSTFIYGKVKVKERKSAYQSIQTSDNKVIIATYQVAAVGINIPRIFNLVMIEAGKSFVRVIQTIGRGIRVAKDKDFVNIWDISSVSKFSKKHLKARLEFYDESEYPHDDYSGTYSEIIDMISEDDDGE